MELLKYSLSTISQALFKIPTAIGKSKLGPVFLMSAGARFTVILETGSFIFEDFKALLILSLLSWTHWSGSQTIVKFGSQAFISTSTSIISLSSQLTVIQNILEIIF
jgi:hypothetical protein